MSRSTNSIEEAHIIVIHTEMGLISAQMHPCFRKLALWDPMIAISAITTTIGLNILAVQFNCRERYEIVK